jgi:DNA-binding response OmpR family regulator
MIQSEKLEKAHMRVLIIEDEPQLARHVSRALSRNGHDPSHTHNGEDGLRVALQENADLIILDLNLPGMDGLSVLSKLRETKSQSRVLILTARGELENRIKGLKAGADDYLAKPFSMDELVARVEALGRRVPVPVAAPSLQVGDVRLDLQTRRVTRNGTQIALSPREFELLHVLMQEPGRVFSRTELCERVWQRDHAYDTRTVEIFIGRLRKKIDADSPDPMIQTIRSVGYCIKAP